MGTRLTVNGVVVEREIEPRRALSDFLREDLGLTGTHVGCEHGVCGACTVLLDGDSVRSCLLFAVQVDRLRVETVESLGTIGRMKYLLPLYNALLGRADTAALARSMFQRFGPGYHPIARGVLAARLDKA